MGIIISSIAAAICSYAGSVAAQQGSNMANKMGDVNNNSGIVTQGQIGNNTLIQTPARSAFDEQIKSDILKMIPKDKIVQLQTIGGNADQNIGNEVQSFLVENGYNVQRSIIGMLAPPPDKPYSLSISGEIAVFTVAPSAR